MYSVSTLQYFSNYICFFTVINPFKSNFLYFYYNFNTAPQSTLQVHISNIKFISLSKQMHFQIYLQLFNTFYGSLDSSEDVPSGLLFFIILSLLTFVLKAYAHISLFKKFHNITNSSRSFHSTVLPRFCFLNFVFIKTCFRKTVYRTKTIYLFNIYYELENLPLKQETLLFLHPLLKYLNMMQKYFMHFFPHVMLPYNHCVRSFEMKFVFQTQQGYSKFKSVTYHSK